MSALESYRGSDSGVSVRGNTDVLPWLTMFETSLPITVQREMIQYLPRLMVVLSLITPECVLLLQTAHSWPTRCRMKPRSVRSCAHWWVPVTLEIDLGAWSCPPHAFPCVSFRWHWSLLLPWATPAESEPKEKRSFVPAWWSEMAQCTGRRCKRQPKGLGCTATASN